jgi:hypothetical protein
MRNADRINFYLAGLRQPGESRAGEGRVGKGRAGEVQVGEIRAGELQAREVQAGGNRGGTALDANPSPRASSPTIPPHRAEIPATAIRPAGDAIPVATESFAAALRSQLAGSDDPALSATLDQAQLRRLLERLDRHRDRYGLGDPTPETARKRQRQLFLGLALAVAIIAVQATAVVWLYQRAELLLGRPLSPELLMTANYGDLGVVFRPSASAGDVAVLLRELNLHVVDGPDAGGRYVVRPETGADSRHALNALRDRRDLVYSADTVY